MLGACLSRSPALHRTICHDLAKQLVNTVLLGVGAFFLAGFLLGGNTFPADPELTIGLACASAGLGVTALVAAGVAWGNRMSRD